MSQRRAGSGQTRGTSPDGRITAPHQPPFFLTHHPREELALRVRVARANGARGRVRGQVGDAYVQGACQGGAAAAEDERQALELVVAAVEGLLEHVGWGVK